MRIQCAGHIAWRALQDGGQGRVGAVFERSFYIEMPTTWLCVIGPWAAMGPLVLRCEEADPTAVRVGQRLALSLAGAAKWSPPPVPPWTRESLRRGLDSLEEIPLPQSLAAAVGTLGAWLAEPAGPADGLAALIGLGPGLTPSGDDFLGGAMIALHLLGEPGLANRLGGIVETTATTAISAAHLAAAAEGSGSAPLHAALGAILAGDIGSIPEALQDVARIGHTSGFDALAGAVTVFRRGPPCT